MVAVAAFDANPRLPPPSERSGRGAPSSNALARLGVLVGTEALAPARSVPVIKLDWPELEQALPDGGLPHGVVELAAMPFSSSRSGLRHGSMRGGGTSIALAAVRSVQSMDEASWCAWIVPEDVPLLYAPAIAQAGVDLDRLLVIRPPPRALARTAVRVATSGAFDLVVIDAPTGLELKSNRRGGAPSLPESIVVRKLALAAEERGTSSILLTNGYTPRPVPWPVALRVEVERRPEALALRVTKDRRGRASSQHVVRLAC